MKALTYYAVFSLFDGMDGMRFASPDALYAFAMERISFADAVPQERFIFSGAHWGFIRKDEATGELVIKLDGKVATPGIAWPVPLDAEYGRTWEKPGQDVNPLTEEERERFGAWLVATGQRLVPTESSSVMASMWQRTSHALPDTETHGEPWVKGSRGFPDLPNRRRSRILACVEGHPHAVMGWFVTGDVAYGGDRSTGETLVFPQRPHFSFDTKEYVDPVKVYAWQYAPAVAPLTEVTE